jgi:type II secretory pathway component HofQ
MRLIKKALASFAASRPAAFNACQAALEKVDGAGAKSKAADVVLLQNAENQKYSDGDGQEFELIQKMKKRNGGDQRERRNYELGETELLLAPLFGGLHPIELLQSMRICLGRTLAA